MPRSRGFIGGSRTRPARTCGEASRARSTDLAAVIGAALEARAAGLGHRRIGERLEVPAATVRGWLRRFAAVASALTGWLLAVAADADPAVRAPPAGPPLAVAVAAVRLSAAAMTSLSGEPVDRWRLVLLDHTA